jgi:integrase
MPRLRPALTDTSVKQSKPTNQRREISDGGSCLALIIQPTGLKSWIVRYRANGARVKRSLGSYPVLSLAAARAAARADREAATSGAAPVPAPSRIAAPAPAPVAIGGATVSEVWADYAARRLPLKKATTQSRYGGVFRKQLLPVWRDRPVASITRDDTNALADDAEEARGPNARNSLITVGSAVFTFALRKNLIVANPFDKIEKLSLDSRDRVLTDVEIKTFWAGCDKLGPIFGPMFQLLLLTGCRRTEVSGMRYSELDAAKRVWNIPASRTKNKRPHQVYLTDAMLAVLSTMPRIEDCDFVFTSNGKTSSTGFSKGKDLLDEIAPLPDWTLHDLRRSFATGCGLLGIPEVDIEKCLNHPKGRVAGTYNRAIYSKEMKAAWEKWSEHVTAL